MAERLVRADSADQKASEGLARSHGSLGEVLVRSGRVDEAIASFEEGSRLYSAMLDRNPTNPEYANMLGNTRRRLCSVIDAAGRPDEALESCLAAERALERAIAAMEANAVARANLAATYVQTARVYRRLASRADLTAANRLRGYARSRYRDALRVFRELDQTDAVAELRADSVAAELATLPNGR